MVAVIQSIVGTWLYQLTHKNFRDIDVCKKTKPVDGADVGLARRNVAHTSFQSHFPIGTRAAFFFFFL